MTIFCIPGRPMPASRPRYSSGKVYNKANYARWLDDAALLIRNAHQGQELIRGDVALGLEVFVADWRRGDLSNYIKAIEDATERAGTVFKNDRQITAVIARLKIDPNELGRTYGYVMPLDEGVAGVTEAALQQYWTHGRGTGA